MFRLYLSRDSIIHHENHREETCELTLVVQKLTLEYQITVKKTRDQLNCLP
jgi:hypothetical protein